MSDEDKYAKQVLPAKQAPTIARRRVLLDTPCCDVVLDVVENSLREDEVSRCPRCKATVAVCRDGGSWAILRVH